jgi:hypothetical protein
MTINDAVKMWPTPKANNPGMSAKTSGRDVTKSTHLTTQVAIAEGMIDLATGRMWPTPTSISPAKNGYNEAGNSCGLVAIRKRISGEDSQATGQLSPIFVEWLMGFPLGWTDLEGSETQ